MPLEKLLAKYNGSPNTELIENEDMDGEEKIEDLDDSEGDTFPNLYCEYKNDKVVLKI